MDEKRTIVWQYGQFQQKTEDNMHIADGVHVALVDFTLQLNVQFAQHCRVETENSLMRGCAKCDGLSSQEPRIHLFVKDLRAPMVAQIRCGVANALLYPPIPAGTPHDQCPHMQARIAREKKAKLRAEKCAQPRLEEIERRTRPRE